MDSVTETTPTLMTTTAMGSPISAKVVVFTLDLRRLAAPQNPGHRPSSMTLEPKTQGSFNVALTSVGNERKTGKT